MPKFRFNVRTVSGAEFWEEYSLNEAFDQATAEKAAAAMIFKFNETERARYGAKADTRDILSVQFLGAGARQHEWQKQNAMTILSPRGGNYDQMRCTTCGIYARRWGLGHKFDILRPFKAKKWRTCPGHLVCTRSGFKIP